MKKYLSIVLVALLGVSVLTGCTGQNKQPNASSSTIGQPQAATDRTSSGNLIPNASDEYAKLIAYKTDGYSKQSISDFNNSLLNGDLAELLEAHTIVMESISSADENYEFIALTLAASLDELYCEQMNDEVGISGYLKKEAQPIKPLSGEENLPTDEQSYNFVFNALYRIKYTIPKSSDMTLAERDNALKTLRTELQNYIDSLSEAEITNGNIKKALTDKSAELASSLSSDNIILSCEINNIEIHNAGEEITP